VEDHILVVDVVAEAETADGQALLPVALRDVG
jgi:hypothetical protein